MRVKISEMFVHFITCVSLKQIPNIALTYGPRQFVCFIIVSYIHKMTKSIYLRLGMNIKIYEIINKYTKQLFKNSLQDKSVIL